MIKKFKKNDTEIEAIQYNGTLENTEEIKEWLGDKINCSNEQSSDREPSFHIAGRTEVYIIYKTNWIIKDGKYYFRASDDIFKDMYTEVE